MIIWQDRKFRKKNQKRFFVPVGNIGLAESSLKARSGPQLLPEGQAKALRNLDVDCYRKRPAFAEADHYVLPVAAILSIEIVTDSAAERAPRAFSRKTSTAGSPKSGHRGQ